MLTIRCTLLCMLLVALLSVAQGQGVEKLPVVDKRLVAPQGVGAETVGNGETLGTAKGITTVILPADYCPNHLSSVDGEGRRLRRYRVSHELLRVKNTDEFWKAQDDLEVVLGACNYFGEPALPSAIDALERLLPTVTSDIVVLVDETKGQYADELKQAVVSLYRDDRAGAAFAAAAWLYRYGREAGYDYLAKTLNDRSIYVRRAARAAAYFALNQDDRQLDAILRLLKEKPTIEDELLFEALGAWRRPEITGALFQEFQKAPDKREYFARALSRQHYIPARPLVADLYERSMFPGNPEPELKVWLISLKATNRGNLLAELVEILKDPELDFFHEDILEYLGMVEDEEIQKLLLSIVEEYVEFGPIEVMKDGARAPVQPIYCAVQAAASLNRFSPSAIEILKAFLRRLHKEEVSPYNKNKIAYILLRTKDAGARRTVETVMGQEWLQKADVIMHLKKMQEEWPY